VDWRRNLDGPFEMALAKGKRASLEAAQRHGEGSAGALYYPRLTLCRAMLQTEQSEKQQDAATRERL